MDESLYKALRGSLSDGRVRDGQQGCGCCGCISMLGPILGMTLLIGLVWVFCLWAGGTGIYLPSWPWWPF